MKSKGKAISLICCFACFFLVADVGFCQVKAAKKPLAPDEVVKNT